MVIERTKKEVIIRLPSSIDTDGLQNIINYLTYTEATNKSQAKQEQVDKLAEEALIQADITINKNMVPV